MSQYIFITLEKKTGFFDSLISNKYEFTCLTAVIKITIAKGITPA
jgi:hypothetical protein